MSTGSNHSKRVVLGVSGSIAAYKSCLIVRGLIAAGAEVRCALTPAAEKFVTPLSLSALSRNAVVADLLDPKHWEMAHLSLASWAEVIVIAPATANTIASLAHGRAADAVGATVLSAKVPVFVAPAMDTEMWEHPATQANIETLKGFGYTILGPVEGELASGRVGMGRLMEPADIVNKVLA
jgi:phosphopantothenoylcysteine decarboxylase/phosphopantothenate--cysteine ligase